LTRSGTSLHRQVYLLLRDRLLGGSLQPGDQLPPEPLLCEQFGVSRITLRRAVSDLEQEGLLERVQGRGTFARTPGRLQTWRSEGYVEDLQQLSADTTVRVLELTDVPAPERVAARLQLASGAPVQRSVRLRLRQGQPLVLLTTWLPQALGQTISKADLTRQALFELLAQRGVRFGRILQEVGASLADPMQAHRLEVAVGSALVVVDRVVHDTEGRPVEYVEIVLASERSRMVFDIPAGLVGQVGSGRIAHSVVASATQGRRRQ
jgi:GntR family transcriptional regulator